MLECKFPGFEGENRVVSLNLDLLGSQLPPLHDVIGERERKPLAFCDASLFLYGWSVSVMLGNLSTVDEGGGDDDGGELNEISVPNDVERSPFVPEEFAACSFKGAGAAGTKNFAPATAGLTDGAEGDWNEFASESPPLLKVSTYLNRSEAI